MFYKFYSDGKRQTVPLQGIYEGQTLFIICGSPTIQNENLELLKQRGILILGINNSAEIFKPNFWVGGDRPECYSERVVLDPSILKFANYGKRDFKLKEKFWKFYPATLFYTTAEKIFTTRNFLDRDYRFCWWKNTFFIGLQLAYRLGFNKVFLIGAEFKISKEKQYAWETNLAENEVNANQRLYNSSVDLMRELKPLFESKNFNVSNCCRTSRLKDDFGFISLENAVNEAIKEIPKKVDTTKLPHSLKGKLK